MSQLKPGGENPLWTKAKADAKLILNRAFYQYSPLHYEAVRRNYDPKLAEAIEYNIADELFRRGAVVALSATEDRYLTVIEETLGSVDGTEDADGNVWDVPEAFDALKKLRALMRANAETRQPTLNGPEP